MLLFATCLMMLRPIHPRPCGGSSSLLVQQIILRQFGRIRNTTSLSVVNTNSSHSIAYFPVSVNHSSGTFGSTCGSTQLPGNANITYCKMFQYVDKMATYWLVHLPVLLDVHLGYFKYLYFEDRFVHCHLHFVTCPTARDHIPIHVA